MMPSHEVSREDTTKEKAFYLAGQLGLEARPGTRAWVRHGLQLRVAESRADRHAAAVIVRWRHYKAAWPVPPKTLCLTYLADLAGVAAGDAGAAGLVMVALLPGNYHAPRALGLEQFEVLTLVRMWRADDLGPKVAPDLTPAMLRRIVKGDRRSGLGSLEEEWTARKVRAEGLRARPRLLVTYADPKMGHDGATYLAAGATACGRGAGGKLLFAWALEPGVRQALGELGRAVKERGASC